MLAKHAIAIIGADISNKNAKMGDSTAYGLSATQCQTGNRLKGCNGSVCSGCYAQRLENMRPSVHQGYMKRTQSVIHSEWVAAMVQRLQSKNKSGYHRWHDSGDLQSVDHLHKIVQVARKMPDIKFWLPTKEYKMVREYVKGHTIPKNLCIRISSPMVDGKPLTVPKTSIKTSTVHKVMDHYGFKCPAPEQGGECKDCKACWDKSVSNVSYKKH